MRYAQGDGLTAERQRPRERIRPARGKDDGVGFCGTSEATRLSDDRFVEPREEPSRGPAAYG
ncbi:hypothetical protein GCM10010129_00350 [Streptomyces fumigatiscleroticus]|nr:hypothetical protein GCM10010129_00350 [Streptomyces fumigatiscleroticus]